MRARSIILFIPLPIQKNIAVWILISPKAKIGNNAVICPISGGIQTLDGYNGFILCPDYNLICTGTKWCLDPISCVNKRSEPKTESYIYNYKASTSQEYQELLNYKVPVKDEIPLYYRYIFYNKIFILFMFFYF